MSELNFNGFFDQLKKEKELKNSKAFAEDLKKEEDLWWFKYEHDENCDINITLPIKKDSNSIAEEN